MEWTYKVLTCALGHVSLEKYEKVNNNGIICFLFELICTTMECVCMYM